MVLLQRIRMVHMLWNRYFPLQLFSCIFAEEIGDLKTCVFQGRGSRPIFSPNSKYMFEITHTALVHCAILYTFRGLHSRIPEPKIYTHKKAVLGCYHAFPERSHKSGILRHHKKTTTYPWKKKSISFIDLGYLPSSAAWTLFFFYSLNFPGSDLGTMASG